MSKSFNPNCFFMGPRGEMEDIIRNVIIKSLEQIKDIRVDVANEMVIDNSYSRCTCDKENKQNNELCEALAQYVNALVSKINERLYFDNQYNVYGVPVYEPNYIAHMLSDVLWPSIIGKLIGDFWNQNNIVWEVSTVTTQLEREVLAILAKVIGFENRFPSINTKFVENWKFKSGYSYGRLTGGGTIANFEALWMFREKVFLAHELAGDDYMILLKNFWDNIINAHNDFLSLIKHLSANNKGVYGKKILFFSSKVAHYSIDKIINALGLGSKNLVKVKVDKNHRIIVNELEREIIKKHNRGYLIGGVVATLGTTEFGSFDPLHEIINLRKELEDEGIWFLVHVDAAWGGPLVLIKDIKQNNRYLLNENTREALNYMKEADTVTIDPHKMLYIPYPAGAILYRDYRDSLLIATHAPYLFHGEMQRKSQGIASLEGSKPGSTAVGIWLTFYAMTSHTESILRGDYTGIMDIDKTDGSIIFLVNREQLLDRYRPILLKTIENTRFLYDKLSKRKDDLAIEVFGEPESNILVFKWKVVKEDNENKRYLNMVLNRLLYCKLFYETIGPPKKRPLKPLDIPKSLGVKGEHKKLEKHRKFTVSFSDDKDYFGVRVVLMNPFINERIIDSFIEKLYDVINNTKRALMVLLRELQSSFNMTHEENLDKLLDFCYEEKIDLVYKYCIKMSKEAKEDSKNYARSCNKLKEFLIKICNRRSGLPECNEVIYILEKLKHQDIRLT